MKIGLTQRVDRVPGRDERRDCLDQHWAGVMLDAGYTPVPLPNQPGQARTWMDAFELGGIVLTGGNDLADLPGANEAALERDTFERELLEVCIARRLPVLGVCRGLQMIVRHFGGSVITVENHVRQPHPIIPRQSPVPTLPRAEVNSFHDFGTRPDLLPAELMLAGVSPDGIVEAVAHRSLPIWAIMWHPERPVRPGSARDEKDITLIRTLFGGGRA